MEAILVLFCVAFFLGPVGFLVFHLIRKSIEHQKRVKEDLYELAAKLGLSYDPLPDRDAPSRYKHLKLFSIGYGDKFFHNLSGRVGDLSLRVCEHQYLTGGQGSRTVRHYTTCLGEVDWLDLPHVYQRPRLKLLDEVGKRFGKREIDFIEDEVYSKAYIVSGEHERAIQHFFDQKLRSWFVEQIPHKLQLEAKGSLVLLRIHGMISKETALLMTELMIELIAILGLHRND